MRKNLLFRALPRMCLFWLFVLFANQYGSAQQFVAATLLKGNDQPGRVASRPEAQINKAGVILINGEGQNMIMLGFDYHFAEGPSARQKFTVQAAGLNDSLVVMAPVNWEISSNATFDGINKYPFRRVAFKPNGNAAVTKRNIHVRLKKDLPAGSYNGTIIISSAGTPERTVQVSGTVAPGRPRISVSGDSVTIKTGQTKPNNLNNTLFKMRKIGTAEEKEIVIMNKGGANLIIYNINIEGTDATQFIVAGVGSLPLTVSAGTEKVVSIRFAPTTAGSKRATVSIQNNDPANSPFTFAIGGKAELCGVVVDSVFSFQGFEAAALGWTYSVTGESSYGNATGFISGKSAAGDNPSSNKLYFNGARSWRLQGQHEGATAGPAVMTFAPVNTTAGEEIKLSIRVAAYSLGTNTDGMDATDLSGQLTTDDMSKVDFLAVDVSPDGGVTWLPQARLVSDDDNLVWGFRTPGAQTASVGYQTTGPPSIIKASGDARYKQLVVTDLPAVPNLQVRIKLQANNEYEFWLLDDVQVAGVARLENVWNGSTWSAGAPASDDLVRFAALFSTAPGQNMQVCRCIIDAPVNVSSGSSLTVTDNLTHNNQLTVESNANFIQIHDSANNTGNGSATVKRDASLRRLDYAYWSSPVSGQKLKDFSPATLNTRFYVYNESNDLFDVIDPLTRHFGDGISGPESPAKGYAIRAPNNYPSAPNPLNAAQQTFTGVFKGKLHNGLITFPLKYQSGSNGEGYGYNLVGNPYASNINFYALADQNADVIHKKGYFWTNVHPTPEMQGSNYPGDGYISNYVIMNGTGTVLLQGDSSATPTSQETVKVGQGFIVKAKKTGNLQFTNAVRTVDPNGIFFSKGTTAQRDRFWLQLVTPLQVVVTTLLGYVPGATDEYDEDYDADLMGVGVDALFMNLDNHKLGIQGRQYPLRKNDAVPLGTHHFADGTYSLRIGAAEGIFANGQQIYLKDKKTGQITNISEAPYAFVAAKGLSEGRFELLFDRPAVLSVGAAQTSVAVVVYREGAEWILQSDEDIDIAELYDANGRLIRKYSDPGKKVTFGVHPSGVYIVRYQVGGKIGSRKIIF